MIRVLQIGFGPLGIKIAKYISQKQTAETIAVVDLNTDLIGKSLFAIDTDLSDKVFIYNSIKKLDSKLDVDIVIIATTSNLEKVVNQIKEIAIFGVPIISTCEELSYPWKLQPKLSKELDMFCKKHRIACLGTGVNPGFLMDYLPSVLSSICEDIEHITVERIQDATLRRIPFQQKIGAGLSLVMFNKQKKAGTLRHVGLQESIYLIADSIGLQLDKIAESLEPVIALNNITTGAIEVKKGDACGVEQIAFGYNNKGECKIKLHFKASVGETNPIDRVTIKGTPSFTSEIKEGINGDVATCAITVNAINSVLKAKFGLHTMASISNPGFIN